MYSPEHCVDFFGRNSPQRARISSFTRFLDHTQRHITISRTPLDERSPRRRDLYLTIHNTHKREWEPCPRRDSNPQSQQARASRNTPQTAKPLESAHFGNTHWKHKGDFDLTRSSKFSLTSGLVGGGGEWSTSRPSRLAPAEWHITHCTGGCVVHRTGPKMCEKFRLTGFWPPDPPACSDTLPQLSYSGRN